MQMQMQPTTINIPQADLDDLYRRLELMRWTDEIPGDGWSHGTNLAYLRELVGYWQTTFDWRLQERHLNTYAQYRATVDGIGIHFLHVRGTGPHPMPLILTHGWPSSFVEMLKIIPLLTDPTSYGGNPTDAFDVVVPSLPGFGFSDRPPQGGLTSAQTADVWTHLMANVLGYSRFGAHGGDVGGGVTNHLGRFHAHEVLGIHLLGVPAQPYLGPDAPALSEREKAYFEAVARWDVEEGAYAHIQQTRPQTLAYGLNDSPVGLAAWIVEKFRAWSDCDGEVERRFTKDELLTNISLYWFTQTINSSFGPYWAYVEPVPFVKGERIEVPVAVAVFPKNIDHPPRELAERVYNLHRWTEMPRGGHFPALEEPELLAEDIRAFFRPLRG
jgi:pimeloyl-ACP methyl ester carboxylesterase